MKSLSNLIEPPKGCPHQDFFQNSKIVTRVGWHPAVAPRELELGTETQKTITSVLTCRTGGLRFIVMYLRGLLYLRGG